MAIGSGSDRLMSEINVTPFVDVMLVLLIIFMVTAPMMVQGVDVALPPVTAQPMETEQEVLTITIDRDQKVYFNDVEIAAGGPLGEKLKAILAAKPQQEVFFRSDKDVPYGTVAAVMAEIQAAGVQKLGMVTEPFNAPAPDPKTGKKG